MRAASSRARSRSRRSGRRPTGAGRAARATASPATRPARRGTPRRTARARAAAAASPTRVSSASNVRLVQPSADRTSAPPIADASPTSARRGANSASVIRIDRRGGCARAARCAARVEPRAQLRHVRVTTAARRCRPAAPAGRRGRRPASPASAPSPRQPAPRTVSACRLEPRIRSTKNVDAAVSIRRSARMLPGRNATRPCAPPDAGPVSDASGLPHALLTQR